MKLIILRENLKAALLRIERGVTDNSNLPILKNVLLDANDTLKLSSTNLEMGISTEAKGKIEKKGALSIPFHPLLSIVVNSDSERITLEAKDDSLDLKTDNYQAKIQGLKADEFPILPSLKEDKGYIKINSQELNSAISEVVHAAQVSELKPELSGILFDFQISLFKLVATDSFRLAEKTVLNSEFETNIEKGFKAIIPLSTINELSKVFADEEIKIIFDENQVFFSSKQSSLISRLIDGEYPDYQAIIPKSFDTNLELEKKDLSTAIKLVSGFSGRSSDIKLNLKPESKTLEIYSSSQSVGENNYLIPVKRAGADFQEIAFNWRYLMSAVQSMHSDDISFNLNGAQKPALIKPLKDESVFYIVMPLES
ncbi:MAG: DNA polymerase III subunit beta [bacterium]|nr:DNA polymerase III subunit beta [bacterium]